MNILKKLYTSSVFRKSTPEELASPVSMMVIMFHRGSSVKYFLIMLWGLVSLHWGINTIAMTWGEWMQEMYSGLVAVIAFFSWLGASYFPKFARYELFASASLVTMLFLYGGVVACLAYQQGDQWYPLLVYSITPAVLPFIRVIFIYRTMIAEAKRKSI